MLPVNSADIIVVCTQSGSADVQFHEAVAMIYMCTAHAARELEVRGAHVAYRVEANCAFQSRHKLALQLSDFLLVLLAGLNSLL